MARIQAQRPGRAGAHGPGLDGAEDGAGEEAAGECRAGAVDRPVRRNAAKPPEREAGEGDHPAPTVRPAARRRAGAVRGAAVGRLTCRAPSCVVGQLGAVRRSRPRGGCRGARRGGRGRARRTGRRRRAGGRRPARPAGGRGCVVACSAARARARGRRSAARRRPAAGSRSEVAASASTSAAASGWPPIRRWRRAVLSSGTGMHRAPRALTTR